MISGALNVFIPGSTRVPINGNLSGLTGKTTVIGTQTFVDVLSPTTVPVNVLSAPPTPATSAPGDTVTDATHGNSPESRDFRIRTFDWDAIIFLLGILYIAGIW
ncbi:hypothetical protein IFR04_015818 [Cadophora malorum]|uniref:Uncharacterized protein n=1 Tax=Cadophora malorum TaxID=108018 RepID=A0A8H7W3K6_9HELO|nr:hypothetical protein IFR04_015818 [Cadophora malorum]